MPKLILDSAEYSWLASTSSKWANYIAAKDPEETSEREVALWQKMKDKFPAILMEDDDEIAVNLTKLEAGEIRSLGKVMMMQLRVDVIGEYEKRQRDNPTKANFYQEYIDKAKDKIAGIEGLLKKIEKAT